MSATLHGLSQVQHDLKHSNYFRAWAALFLVVFIVFWVVSHRLPSLRFAFSPRRASEPSSTMLVARRISLLPGAFVLRGSFRATKFNRFTPMAMVTYPTFHFRLEGWHNASMAINYDSVNCVWNHTVNLAIAPCVGYPAPSQNMANCFAVQTHNSTFSAYGLARALPIHRGAKLTSISGGKLEPRPHPPRQSDPAPSGPLRSRTCTILSSAGRAHMPPDPGCIS